MLPTRDLCFIFKDTQKLKGKGWKTIFYAVVTTREQEWLYLYQIKYFQPKSVTRDKEGHHTVIKRSDHQEDITAVNNTGAPDHLRHS